jgi:preprotein translocase subunit SecG
MFGFLLTLLIIDALLLSVVVLLQAGQGGGLASLGGGTTAQVLGGRGASTLLTKASWWMGGIFMALSLLLSLAHTRGSQAQTDVQQILEQQGQFQQPVDPTTTAPLEITDAPPPIPGGDGSVTPAQPDAGTP